MNESIEFTPKELLTISIYKNPDALFSKSIMRLLLFVIPSVCLVGYYIISGDPAAGFMGYGLLLFRMVYRQIILKRGLQTTASIIRKYEAKLENKQANP